MPGDDINWREWLNLDRDSIRMGGKPVVYTLSIGFNQAAKLG